MTSETTASQIDQMVGGLRKNNMYLLTELGRAGRENIWPEVRTERSEVCAP